MQTAEPSGAETMQPQVQQQHGTLSSSGPAEPLCRGERGSCPRPQQAQHLPELYPDGISLYFSHSFWPTSTPSGTPWALTHAVWVWAGAVEFLCFIPLLNGSALAPCRIATGCTLTDALYMSGLSELCFILVQSEKSCF